MNDEAIYFKTPAGEEAMRERTRLVQRNLRMVLIIVDGLANVAELKREAGDAAMVESALAELELMGLVESEEAHAARLAGEHELPFALDELLLPASAEDGSSAAAEAAPVVPGGREGLVAPPVEAPRRRPPSALARWWAAWSKRRGRAKKSVVAGRRAEAVAEPPVRIGPVRHHRPRLGFWPRLTLAAAGALALAALVVVLFPYDRYRPEAEQRLALAFGEPVAIGGMRVAFSPFPSITVEQVAVGSPPYATIAAIHALPELGSLFGSLRYSVVRAEGLRLGDEGLGRLSRWLPAAAAEGLGTGSLELAGVSLDLGQASIDGLAGTAQLDEGRGLARIILNAQEGRVEAEILPGRSEMAVAVTARDWKLPFTPALRFDTLELKGRLSPGRFVIDRLEGALYDGRLKGAGELVWGREAGFAAAIDFQRLAAGPLTTALAAEPGIEGAASGRLRLAARAPDLARLPAAVQIEGGFSITQGSLLRIDLVEAVRAVGKAAPLRGGRTRFEQFSGSFAADAGTVRLTGLELSSGLLRATGQATVARQARTISGSARVELRSSAGASRAGVAVSGSVDDPELKVGR